MWRKHFKEILKYFIVILCICAFGVFIYPGLYRYDKLDQKYPVMINRITGETKVLYGDIWSSVGNVDNQMSKFIEYKEGIEATLDIQSDKIKRDVLTEITKQLEEAKNSVISEAKKTTEKQSADSFFADVRNRDSDEVTETGEEFIERRRKELSESSGTTLFGLGDTKETVKLSMGTPSTIMNNGNTWFFDSATVNFENNLVVGWNDPLNVLKLE
ncbi:hypothetical protein [Paenibacillus sp. FSL R7-0333]|uniref:hypothetical protein n=1 Tax=Paenibacillus sp. FSL R7-0333 TaxID=1926587 RepID=UPI00096E7CA9|nr:hypothetical protein BK146_17695 [Paenibacillus sp. FSL R7-0333]